MFHLNVIGCEIYIIFVITVLFEAMLFVYILTEKRKMPKKNQKKQSKTAVFGVQLGFGAL